MKMATEQRYTMIYVPWLLLAGLTALFLAALLTVLLAASLLNSEVFRKGRLLDPTRMVVDIGGLVEPETLIASQTRSENRSC